MGAGPAGILAAVYLARRGHEVHLFERRPSPLVQDASDHRAFFVVLQPRGAAALKGAGFALRPGGGLQPVAGIARGRGLRPQQLRVAFRQPRLMGPRHAFVRQMVQQAEAMLLPNLHFHWQTAFEGADLPSQTATFRCSDGADGSDADGTSGGSASSGDSLSFRYDLLVAADGGWSRVRRAAEAQTPELQVGEGKGRGCYGWGQLLPPCLLHSWEPLPGPGMPPPVQLVSPCLNHAGSTVQTLPSPQVSVEQGEGRYKVFRGLPASPAISFHAAASSAGGKSGSSGGDSAGASAGVQLQMLHPAGTGGFRHPGLMFLAPDPTSSEGAACGMLAMGQQGWEGIESAQDWLAVLTQQFPALPPEWLPEVRGSGCGGKGGSVLLRPGGCLFVNACAAHHSAQPGKQAGCAALCTVLTPCVLCCPTPADGRPAGGGPACGGGHARARLPAARPLAGAAGRCRTRGEGTAEGWGA